MANRDLASDWRTRCDRLQDEVLEIMAMPKRQLISSAGVLAGPDEPHYRRVATRGRVFIGHGNSDVWLRLKDFIVERLRLQYEEFNREPAAGLATTQRLEQMLESAAFAFIVLTAEDELADGTKRARQNVVHEAGLFQGKLGFTKAILLVEDGCDEFSNIHGLTQLRFPRGRIMAISEEVRRVLEREGLLNQS